jgi:hypothetical protein
MLRALQAGLGESRVLGKASYDLGLRNGRSLTITPDITIDATTLIDAKYKAATKQRRTRVAEADVYEALAFMQGANARRTVLLYPRVPRGQPRIDPGTCLLFDRIEVGDKEVFGLEVECRGIGVSGFQAFSDALGGGVNALVS